MTVRELREKYLAFFESKGHSRHPSGSLIPIDVTGRLDESLLFNGAGMIQFKPYFRGVAQPPNKRLITCQKCVRTGDIESVGDLSHLTFFEMLGNFSFGDYFKTEAIAYSWEFLTSPEWLALEPHKLSFTVYETDDEAYEAWSIHLRDAGIEPSTRVFRLGEETNYWPAGAFSAGPPGPCGPNSEMFYWTASSPPPPVDKGYSVSDWIADDASQNWLEIWNDVFIQSEWQGRLRNPERPGEGYVKEGMPDLPFKSVDTGMGLDRTAAVLMGKASVYDTDVFAPILRAIDGIRSGYLYGSHDGKDTATRVIADHIRTACFCIADGILPGNAGRGYVLRRLIRRAVLKGQRVLGFEEPFFHRVFEGVLEAMGDHYTELREKREVIVETLRNEEALFRRTVAQGQEILQEELVALGQLGSNVEKRLSGRQAFMLYDTFGFPLEVTQELCSEAGVEVDLEGYEAALKEAQERSRGSQERESVYGGVGAIQFEVVIEVEDDAEEATPTVFLGYDRTEAQTVVVGALPEPRTFNEAGSSFAIALKESPFYAASGGQIADTGTIAGAGFEGRVVDVVKQNGIFVHAVEPTAGLPNLSGQPLREATETLQKKLFNKTVEAMIDVPRRARIMRNHTATHLLHAALRQVLGKHVTQAGSYVGPDRLRFDFTHGKAMSEDELGEVERIVNEEALKNTPVVTYADIPIAEAKARGAMALFGEKYGDHVRMVEIGDFSRELCGGTHVRFTGEIGLFKIVSEASAASGVRRIEALTGDGAYEWLLDQLKGVDEAAAKLKLPPKSGAKDLGHGIDRLLEAQKDLKQRLEKARSQGTVASSAAIELVGSVELARERVDGDAKDAALVADRLADSAPNRVVLVAGVSAGKIAFVAKVGTDALAKGAHAGNLLREVAKIAGGGGGGKADFATAGGKDPAKADAALEAGKNVLAGMLSG